MHYPWVIRDDKQVVMWYTSEGDKTRWYLTRAVSEDGITWRREPEDHPVISISLARSVSPLNWIIPRKLLRLFPHYFTPYYRASFPNHADFPQGITGKILYVLHDNLIFPFRSRRYVSFENSSVVKLENGTYLMYFQGRNENVFFAIGIATSPDGINWKPSQTGILRDTIKKEGIGWCSAFDADPHILIWKE